VLWEPGDAAAAATAAPTADGGSGTDTAVTAAAADGSEQQPVVVDPMLTRWLRPHQREGVQFMFDCVCGLRLQGGQGESAAAASSGSAHFQGMQAYLKGSSLDQQQQ
jgi:hypothetical protein